jgi:hypothetical protein
VAKPEGVERELQALAAQLRKVEAEYTTYFSGRSQRPPIESRAALDRAFRQYDRARFETPVLRFQFQTLQARHSAFTDLWDRGVRAREEGRAGPFVRPAAPGVAPASEEVVLSTAIDDPARQSEQLHDLYETMMEVRRAEGQDVVPFHKFASLVREQVQTLQQRHPGDEVWFKVTRRDGKAHLTAQAVKPRYRQERS